jgi:hypothetical protein
MVESPASQTVTFAGALGEALLGRALLGLALLGLALLGLALLGPVDGLRLVDGLAQGLGAGVPPPHAVPLKVKLAGTGLPPVHAPLKPKLTVALLASAPL